MKNFLFAVAALLSLAACSRNIGTDESNLELNSPSSIIGTWQFTGSKIISGANGSVLLSVAVGSNCSSLDTFVFKTDGTAVERIHSQRGSGCATLHTNNYTFSYNVERKTLKLTDEDENVQTKKIRYLDDTHLEFIFNTGDYNEDGSFDKFVSVFTKVR